MRGNRHSTPTRSQAPSAPAPNSIAIDGDLLSLITSKEAEAITDQMSRIYLLLLSQVPADADASLPVAQEWLLRFDGEGADISPESAYQQLAGVMEEVDEQELRQALAWMSKHRIIDVWVEEGSLYLAVRNALAVHPKNQ